MSGEVEVVVRRARAADAAARYELVRQGYNSHLWETFFYFFFQELTLECCVLGGAVLFIFCGVSAAGAAAVLPAAAAAVLAAVLLAGHALAIEQAQKVSKEMLGVVAEARGPLLAAPPARVALREAPLDEPPAAPHQPCHTQVVGTASVAALRGAAGAGWLHALAVHPQSVPPLRRSHVLHIFFILTQNKQQSAASGFRFSANTQRGAKIRVVFGRTVNVSRACRRRWRRRGVARALERAARRAAGAAGLRALEAAATPLQPAARALLHRQGSAPSRPSLIECSIRIESIFFYSKTVVYRTFKSQCNSYHFRCFVTEKRRKKLHNTHLLKKMFHTMALNLVVHLELGLLHTAPFYQSNNNLTYSYSTLFYIAFVNDKFKLIFPPSIRHHTVGRWECRGAYSRPLCGAALQLPVARLACSLAHPALDLA
ncbi:uncharacterized protein [Epargyreus clarus]|uniref:uncharacterized protein n=1 Tax=Epargyreus clarus TaxID=520877 RepID=UPI003C2D3EB2